MATKLESKPKPEVRNEQGEKLDVLVEGKADAKATIIFVHGLGTNKNEGNNLFGEIASKLGDRYRIVRFDLSGCGASEGKEEDFNLRKWSRDLDSVLKYVKAHYKGEVFIIAHSFGTFVTTRLAPEGVKGAIFVAMANKDTSGSSIKARIRSRGGVVNEEGISTYPRSTGEVQKLDLLSGKNWRTSHPSHL